jgi:putative membrane protein
MRTSIITQGDGWEWLALMNLVWWVLIILVILTVLRWSARQQAPQEEDLALTILRERYARGEIGQAEFEQRQRDLLVR